MSRGEVAALNRPRIRRSRSACCAWTPAFEPVAKNLANPLCLNPRITRISVTQDVTGHKTPNARDQPRPKAVGCIPKLGVRASAPWDMGCHSMTSSARASADGGIVSPRARAAFILITSSIFLGASTGRSAGLAPRRILSM